MFLTHHSFSFYLTFCYLYTTSFWLGATPAHLVSPRYPSPSFSFPATSPATVSHFSSPAFILNNSHSPGRKTNVFFWANHLMYLFCWTPIQQVGKEHKYTPVKHSHTNREHSHIDIQTSMCVLVYKSTIKMSLGYWKCVLEGGQALAIHFSPALLHLGRMRKEGIKLGGHYRWRWKCILGGLRRRRKKNWKGNA